jgi:ATP-dependent Clp protease ATP-binding subunit ClpB
MRDAVHEALKARFLPEFLNRIDDIVTFHPLQKSELRKIVQLQLEHLSARLEENGLSLSVSDQAIDEIAAVGYDPTYGARPLKRVIQREIQNPLATALLKEAYPEGSTVHVDFDGQQFTFSDKASELAAS